MHAACGAMPCVYESVDQQIEVGLELTLGVLVHTSARQYEAKPPGQCHESGPHVSAARPAQQAADDAGDALPVLGFGVSCARPALVIA